MTPDQERDLQTIKDEFVRAVDSKYRKGQAEHGGDLYSMNTFRLLNEAILESIDLFVYLTTLRRKMIEDVEEGCSG